MGIMAKISPVGLTLVSAWGTLAVGMAAAQTAATYQKPPAAIEKLLDAPPTPTVRVSPDAAMLLVEQPANFPTIADVAQPRYRLAGIRFNPATSGPSAESYNVGLKLQAVSGGADRTISGLPAKLKAAGALWSPDSQHIVFTQRTDATERAETAAKPAGAKVMQAAGAGAGLELWVIDVASGRAHRVGGTTHLNAVLGRPCGWLPDSSGLLCKVNPAGRGAPPPATEVPTGPVISENLGKARPAPTYEDMLESPSDEAIFAFYASSQLAIVPLNGALKTLPVTGLIESGRPSPDGRYALVSVVHKPFSYTIPYERFPLLTEVVGLKDNAAPKVLFDRPAVDNLPISRDAVEIGPRNYQWRSDVPATVAWVEAADGGDPRKKVEVRDKVKGLSAPFTGEPVTLLELPMRLQRGFGAGAGTGIEWGNEHLALATESRWSDRKLRIVAFDPSAPGKQTTLWEGSSQDRYHNPGRPVTHMNASGQPVLQLTTDGSAIFFFSPGATPQGDQPFVATMPVTGGEETILLRSADPYFTEPLALAGPDRVLVRRESQTEPPNVFLSTMRGRVAPVQVTHFASPYEGIPMPTRQLLHYKRADGVELTATLWLPAGYDKSQGPLPTLLEAYPAEFKTRAAAAQVSGSTNRFPTFGWGGSPVYFTQVGYAVIENAAIPIIGEGEAQPNDTYIQQLVDGAKAAVNYSVSLGVVDRNRVGVMGHSYGAFMTANLLAHSNLFRAGIARSGAYNRTLTPYGFQNEERTYWQAPDVYHEMSPFSFADKIKVPILLLHGQADDNTGTYPIQSERFYAALKGQGATVRLVFLPLEAHHYAAHESLQHMLWEMDRWLDTYVKPEKPVTAATAGE